MWGLLIVALCCWCASRWSVWFENPEEDAYEPSDVPARILLSFGDEDGECNRNISWTCGTEVKESFVELSTLNCHLPLARCLLLVMGRLLIM